MVEIYSFTISDIKDFNVEEAKEDEDRTFLKSLALSSQRIAISTKGNLFVCLREAL